MLVDGENIDATLGDSVLSAPPRARGAPALGAGPEYAESLWGQPVTGLFFLNASAGHMPIGFVQALLALDYRPIPLAGRADQKVVDIGIQRTLDALIGHRTPTSCSAATTPTSCPRSRRCSTTTVGSA